ncbi:uncharacterized protein [Asterias amurensis]|uniref:uncharacterized protein n=1 Tax=Asterias amurensis TaxID=7602 RepID=UPI003AB51FD0
MWSYAVLCMLLVGAMAQKPTPCCLPQYFTLRNVDIINTAPNGELKVEYANTERAYDAISQQLSIFYDVEYFNGTEVLGRYIADFKEKVLYIIIKVGDDEHCFPYHIDQNFAEECIPDDAEFVRESWIGENDLLVDTWFASRKPSPESEVQTVLTVGRKECVPVSRVSTYINPSTGEVLRVEDTQTFNFKLGICDRERFFKVPDACRPGNALKAPTLAMQKILDKFSRGRKFM